MKKKIWGVLLSVAVLVTTVNFPATAGAEENKGGADASGIVVKVSDDMNGSNANESDEIQTVQISAQNQSDMDAVVRIFLLNEDKETADTEVEIPNLCDKDQITDETVQTEMAETLKSALTLEDGTNSALDAQWIEKKDDSGNVTAKYLEAALPAGTAAAFDMQLMYRTDEENYTKKTIVRAKAFVDEQDVTEASDVEDEDNEAEVKWEVVKVEEESEAAEESEESEKTVSKAAKASRAAVKSDETSSTVTTYANGAQSGQTVYYRKNTINHDIWDNATQIYIYGIYADGSNTGIQQMERSSHPDLADGWQYTFDKTVNTIIFLVQSTFGNEAAQTVDITIASSARNYCYFVTGNSGAKKTVTYKVLPDISYSGENLSFFDMTASLDLFGITARFQTESGTESTPVSIENGSFTVPNDSSDTDPYTKVCFNVGNDSTDWVELSDIVRNGTTTFYYGRTTLSSGALISSWDEPLAGNESLAGKKLFFESSDFPINSEIQIGTDESVQLSHTTSEASMLSYDIPGDSSATQQTIITVTTNGNAYRFLWNDLTQNLAVLNDNVVTVSDNYSPDGTVIYFDATLSKLSYDGDVSGIGIPNSTGRIVCHAYTGSIYQDVVMEKLEARTSGGNTWSDVYRAELNEQYENVIFYTGDNWPLENSQARTKAYEIDWTKARPCFYADSSDSIAYDGGAREGYWDEVYRIRDATSGKGTEVVDVNEGTLTRESDVLYIDTTLYDYYTDYELNGNNRDNYSNTTITSHRIYQPFRQFNQALSSYYEKNEASSPLYWGNFQNFPGSKFSEIANTLELFDFENNENSDKYKKFFYENNSMWGRDGKVLSSGENATQGLVAPTLSESGNLQIQTTESGTVDAPYFNTDFLEKSNSKNTVLGKIYEDVTFPFVKVDLKSQSDTSATGTVGYWCFDSKSQDNKNKNLQLQYSEQDGYFLQPTNEIVEGQTTSGTTGVGNYFPFNTSSQSGNAAKLNYGFGQKIEFDFRLTENGTVKTSAESGTEYVPIEFNFSGDDDVWVFIDGYLVLDVGGGHDVVSGTINFENKTATVRGVKGTASGLAGNVTVNFPEELSNDNFNNEEHTLTMFYMERGLWESNMMITFNFPDENEFAVEKQVDDTDVNQELFAGVFDDASVFPFTIQNQATHYGKKEVDTSEATEPVTYNTTFLPEDIKVSHEYNTFEQKEEFAGRSDVVYWYTKADNVGGSDKDLRFGVISPNSGETFDASKADKYLQFKAYYNWSDTPGLAYMYIQLEDADGDTIGGYLSGKTYGNSNLKGKTWNTIQVDLSKLDEKTYAGGSNQTFDFAKVKYIKFNYDYGRNFYLDDFIFIPSVVAQGNSGFVKAQDEIPDYGSSESGKLENAAGAQYTLEDTAGKATTYRLTSSGMFALADGETATFKDQFRRGSYIAVTEDVDQDVFETTWTLYENGTPVSLINSGNTVEIESNQNLINVAGTTLKDGRKEKYVENIGNTGYPKTDQAKDSNGTPTENTIVFRSYSNPDSETALTKLKAVFTNKVKTGSIVIKKEKADSSTALTGQYTFKVVFNNVAGMSLEKKAIEKTYTIDMERGESQVVINGIPAGTDYRIEEISATDGATLENVVIEQNGVTNAQYDPVTKVVSGKVIASETSSANITFKNTLKPTIDINLEKQWKNTEGVELPESIRIKLQRSSDNGNSWNDVQYAGDTAVIELIPEYDGKWTYSFVDLDQYVNYQISDKVPWLYRIVELDEDNNVIESGGYLNDLFKVTYSDDYISVTDPAPDTPYDYTITNTYNPEGTVKIIKENGEGNSLEGAEFALYTTKDGNKIATDSKGKDLKGTTGSEGELIFDNIPAGTKGKPKPYYLKELKTAAGYVLLKEPIEVKLPYEYHKGDIVNGDKVTEDGMTWSLTYTIVNDKAFDLPASGLSGIGPIAAAGIAIVVIAGAVFAARNIKGQRAASNRRKHRPH